MKLTNPHHTTKTVEIKHVLTPLQFLAQMPPSSRMPITQAIMAKNMIEYFYYRQEWLQNKTNKYAESIGVIKSVISLIKNQLNTAARIVLINCGFNSHELTARLSSVLEYTPYKAPKHITIFIRQTLDGVKGREQNLPVLNTANGYVIIAGNACPSVTMDENSTVLCPFCNSRHKHRLRGKTPVNNHLPDGHFELPCLSLHHAPLQMFDDTICHPKYGYFIENFKTMNSTEIIYKPKTK